MILVRVTLGGICCGVVVNTAGRIFRTAPILTRFRGKPLANLARWVLKQGGELERLC